MLSSVKLSNLSDRLFEGYAFIGQWSNNDKTWCLVFVDKNTDNVIYLLKLQRAVSFDDEIKIMKEIKNSLVC